MPTEFKKDAPGSSPPCGEPSPGAAWPLGQAEQLAAVTALNGAAPPRVWSFLVTLFGDLAPAPEAALSGPLLRGLCAPLGISGAAVRVALHRLRGEGWIESEKLGRARLYRLTAMGRAETEAARARVYRREGLAMEAVTLLLLPPGTTAPGPLIAPQLAVASHAAASGVAVPDAGRDLSLALPWPEAPLPVWARARLAPDEIGAGYRALRERLDRINLPPEPVSPMVRAVLRGVIVHHWRRLVLRHEDLPDQIFPESWPIAATRAQVMTRLDRLPVPDLAQIDPVKSG